MPTSKKCHAKTLIRELTFFKFGIPCKKDNLVLYE